MRVFSIGNDVNHYQYFLTEREEDVGVMHEMDCTPRASQWRPPPVYVYKPRHKLGDFFQFSEPALITSQRATEVLRGHLEQAGELLPLPYQGQIYTLLNVLECVDCLDVQRSVKRPGYYKVYVFDPERLSRVRSTIFKVPQNARSDVLVVEGLRPPEEELRYLVEKSGLRGLIFKEIWNDDPQSGAEAVEGRES